MRFFRVNISGTKFFLSEKNIKSDAPNLFTNRFEKELTGGNMGNNSINLRMAVDRNPTIFEYIHRHLQGYDVNSSCIPSHLLQHVLEDAHYYCLEKLVSKLENPTISTVRQIQSEYLPLVEYESSISDSDSESDVDSDSDALLDLVNERRLAGFRNEEAFYDTEVHPEINIMKSLSRTEKMLKQMQDLQTCSQYPDIRRTDEFEEDWEDTWDSNRMEKTKHD